MEGSKYWESVGDNREFMTSNPDLSQAPDVTLKIEDKGLLEAGLNKLSERQRWVIINYFGVFGHAHMTYQEIGTHLRISRQAATQRVHTAIRKLRKFIRKMEAGI